MDIKDIAQSSAYHVSAEITFLVRFSWENLSRNHGSHYLKPIIPKVSNLLTPRRD